MEKERSFNILVDHDLHRSHFLMHVFNIQPRANHQSQRSNHFYFSLEIHFAGWRLYRYWWNPPPVCASFNNASIEIAILSSWLIQVCLSLCLNWMNSGSVAIIRKEVTVEPYLSLDNMVRTSLFDLRLLGYSGSLNMFDGIKCEIDSVFEGVFARLD